MNATVPNFFILGAAKAGTTTLYEYLAAHPEIFMSPVKEPQFFCHDGVYSRGFAYYMETFFAGSSGYKVRGEATPHYLYYEKAAQRIANELPKDTLRFIVMVRDPVARAYSLYWNMVAEGIETLPFSAALAAEADRITNPELAAAGAVSFHYYDSGLYARQIAAYLKYFDSSQFLIVPFEDMKTSPEAILGRVCDFLGVDRFDGLPAVRSTNAAAMPRSMHLQRWLRGASGVKRALGSVLPPRLKFRVTESLLAINRRATSYPSLDAELAHALRVRFADDVRELERIAGISFSGWLPSRATTMLRSEDSAA